MEQCARVGTTERILGISLVFCSTLPFSSPNSLYSSPSTIHCSCCRNEPKEMEDQLRHPSHVTPLKMFWYNDSPRHQNVCKVLTLVLQGKYATAGFKPHRKADRQRVKCSSCVLEMTSLWAHPNLSIESLMEWFKQTVNGWIPVICMPLIMSHQVPTDYRWQEAHALS